MRTFFIASLVFVFANAVAAAEEYSAFITKFEDGKMVVKKSEKDEEITLKYTDKLKIVRGKFSTETMKIEAGEAYEGGKDAFIKQVKATAEQVKKWTEEGKKGFGIGVFARIVTDGDTVTEIRVTGGGKKK